MKIARVVIIAILLIAVAAVAVIGATGGFDKELTATPTLTPTAMATPTPTPAPEASNGKPSLVWLGPELEGSMFAYHWSYGWEPSCHASSSVYQLVNEGEAGTATIEAYIHIYPEEYECVKSSFSQEVFLESGEILDIMIKAWEDSSDWDCIGGSTRLSRRNDGSQVFVIEPSGGPINVMVIPGYELLEPHRLELRVEIESSSFSTYGRPEPGAIWPLTKD